MADNYIDQYETLSYGPFALEQIATFVRPLDPRFQAALDVVTNDLQGANQAMEAALGRTRNVQPFTYKGAAGEGDPLETARGVFRRLVSYVESQPGGAALSAALRQGQNLSTILRRRPAKLLGHLGHALTVLAEHQAELPEYATRAAELEAARQALAALDQKVRGARVSRKKMTPEVRAGRKRWLRAYGTAKLQVEVILRLHERLELMPEIFDDLAEVHRAPGVSDEAPEPEEEEDGEDEGAAAAASAAAGAAAGGEEAREVGQKEEGREKKGEGEK